MEEDGKIREASYYKALRDKAVQCQLCPHFCTIKDGERGKCEVKENRKGILYSLVYGKACSADCDPIEKKPLYHFMPGEKAMSVATIGCNLHCKQCQNWQISQTKFEYYPYITLLPQEVVDKTIESECGIIAYTYTEPTVFYEYMLDTAKIAKKQGIKNVIVSNGFINPEPLKELCKYIDGANIDLKSFSEGFYNEICDGRLEPVLKAIEILHENNVWVEITNLIIPTLNDKEEETKRLAEWVKRLDANIPLHFSAFYPTYKLQDITPTPDSILKKARKIALKAGLKYVYTGNIDDDEGSATFCPKCGKAVIKRKDFFVLQNNLKKGACSCGGRIPGIWS